MTLMQVWGVLLIFTVCPILGGLPLIAWITHALTGRHLAELGTGNVGVQAAFYHGGRMAGILSVLSEAGKGIAAVLLARAFFPAGSVWELVAIIALVAGRYAIARGAGTTNVVWGIVAHDWRVAILVFLIGSTSFTIVRERQLGRLWVLILLPAIVALLNPHDGARLMAAIALSTLLAWIYKTIPDDLDLSAASAREDSQKMFRFFRGDRAIVSLAQPLVPRKVGSKASTLAQLKRWGYPVPMGWVLPPGDDSTPLIESLKPSITSPLVVRSSAIGEDTEHASAAGQYLTILNVTSQEELQEAIARCLASYDTPAAQAYRRDRLLPEDSMSVLIQQQIRGVFSGVAFSRDPIERQGDAVVIEALPGDATRVVSGQVTPEQYRVIVRDSDLDNVNSWLIPAGIELEIEGEIGDLPPALIQQVAFLARHLEKRYHGIPQDIEWTYDGQTLWLLQARPVTTLLPIWTRKIAAEVIPGLIRPLTWSINRPLTCGVWGELFTVVLGNGAAGLDFNETATLHYSRAYFNASLLGQIFLLMGLPPESLEFLTRGAKFTKPPLLSTLKQIPGLLRLFAREWSLEEDFERDNRRYFVPTLQAAGSGLSLLSDLQLLQRIDSILEGLKRATYYSILAPLSLAVRQAFLKVNDAELDNSQLPEVAASRSLQELAAATRHLISSLDRSIPETAVLFARLAEIPDGRTVLEQVDRLLDRYGYLSEAATDIAVPRWKEDPQAMRELFTQFLFNPPPPSPTPSNPGKNAKIVQRRLNLKGKVTEVYSQLLAELRKGFIALENIWLQSGVLSQVGDIFFLEFEEIRRIVAGNDKRLMQRISALIEMRRSQLEGDRALTTVPSVVYGKAPPAPNVSVGGISSQQLKGIGASPGQVEGRVKILRNLQATSDIDRNTILVVPYTDSGWAAVLARAGGLIAEVGGRLSHGAIVAREYGIPAVMDIHNATHLLRDGQRVRIDGQKGIIEIL